MIRPLDPPGPAGLPATADAWLDSIGEPFWLRVPGRDGARVRAIVTLLHGNEPSGVRALHAWLREGPAPAVDVACFVVSVAAARTEPRFSHRMRPGRRDQNRCFADHRDDDEGRIAATLLAELRALSPEAVIDLHNTSGAGPAYGVSTRLDPARLALVAGFARHLVVTDLRLGALMEALEDEVPIVTIECGGAHDTAADAVASRGIERYAQADDVLRLPLGHEPPVVQMHPVRVRLAQRARVLYANAPGNGVDLTLRADLDRHNFDPVAPEDPLGWLGEGGLSVLRAERADGTDVTAELFEDREGRLHVRQSLDLLMVTTDPEIARSDCLFYAVRP